MHQSGPLPAHPALWRAGRPDANRARSAAHASGFPALDALLEGGGWPAGALTELLCDTPGVGELRLLAPALARLSRDEARWIVWIAPPFLPYAPALARAGIDTGRMLLVRPKDRRDASWALDQALRSGAASAVLAWLDESALKGAATRRLQLAAVQGRTWATLFRPGRAAGTASMAALRILVEGEAAERCDRLALTVLKRRGGRSGARVSLEVPPAPLRHGRADLEARLASWRASRESGARPARREGRGAAERFPRAAPVAAEATLPASAAGAGPAPVSVLPGARGLGGAPPGSRGPWRPVPRDAPARPAARGGA